MTDLPETIPVSLRSRRTEPVLGSLTALGTALVMTSGDNALFFMGVLVSALITYFFPLLIVSAHFATFILPAVLMKCLGDHRTWDVMFDAFSISDTVFGIMFTVVLIRLALILYRRLLNNQYLGTDIQLIAGMAGLGGWFIFEIARNLGVYGLSAAGEFRNHYIMLLTPVFIALFFDSARKRDTLFKLSLAFCVLIPLLAIPLIGEIKGWAIGPRNRFFPADISFGILQGLMFCFIGNKHGLVRIPAAFLWAAYLTGTLVIIFDTHRSVWFPFIPMLAVYFWLDTARMSRSFKRIITFAGLGAIVFFIASAAVRSQLHENLVDFILDRGEDILIVEDTAESTWAWRINRWEMEMEKIEASPLIGIGFGGYWGRPDQVESSGIYPHNLYIQILVKLGIVGLILYACIVLRIFYRLLRALRILKGRGDPEHVLIIAGIIALVGSHTHYLAYAFDPFSLFFIGIAMAVAQKAVARE